MVRIAFAIYRQWGYEIFKRILAYQSINKDFEISALIFSDNQSLTNSQIFPTQKTYIVNPNDTDTIYSICAENKIDIICFYSWSFIVNQQLVDNFICLCLHPSKLPLYRGGTPLQHQIIDGVTHSAVTIFKMSKNIDAGDIYDQRPLLLTGDISMVFRRMITIGTAMTKELINDATNGELRFTPQQNLELFPPNKRRTPSQSELYLKEIPNMTFKELNNLVRCLTDPYPNAFISLKDGKILIQKIKFIHSLQKDQQLITLKSSTLDVKKNKQQYLKIKRGYVELIEYKVSTN